MFESDEALRIYGTRDEEWNVQGTRIWIEPSEMSDRKKLNFSYSMKDFGEENLDVQLNFEYPIYVS